MTNTSTYSKVIALKTVPIADLKPAKYNPRKMDGKSFEALVAAIRDYGQRENLIINKDMTVISGHQRLRAMQRLGFKEVMCDVVDLTKSDEKTLNLIMNNPLMQGRFDMLKVGKLLEELRISPQLSEYRLPEMSKLELRKPQTVLAETFVVPPFSVIDSRATYWQQRKHYWMGKIGDQAEGRPNANVFDNKKGSKYMKDKITRSGGGVSIFDPVLAEVICKWFALPGGTIFDPFAGGTFGYVAGSQGFKFTGIELRKEQADLNQKLMDKDKLPSKYVCDDGLNMDDHIEAESQDFIFTCPPYADLEHYSDLPNDLSNMGHDDFFRVYGHVLTKTYSRLKNNRFATIVVSEVRDKSGAYIGLVPKTIDSMELAGYKFYNEIILVNAFGSLPLRARRAMASRKVGRTHQNVLVFYKGDPKQIKNNYPQLVEKEQ